MWKSDKNRHSRSANSQLISSSWGSKKKQNKHANNIMHIEKYLGLFHRIRMLCGRTGKRNRTNHEVLTITLRPYAVETMYFAIVFGFIDLLWFLFKNFPKHNQKFYTRLNINTIQPPETVCVCVSELLSIAPSLSPSLPFRSLSSFVGKKNKYTVNKHLHSGMVYIVCEWQK